MSGGSFEDTMQVVSESKKQVMACKIEGECDDCVNLLVNENKEKPLSGEQGAE